MLMNYSITTKNTIYVLKEMILLSGILLVALIALYFYIYEEAPELFLFITLLLLIANVGINILPVLILYFNYEKVNDGVILNLAKDRFLVNGKSILLDEIKSIKTYATHQHFSGQNGAASLTYNDYFYYMEVITNNEEKIHLTSLLGYNLDKDIQKMYPDIRVENVVKSYPIISRS